MAARIARQLSTFVPLFPFLASSPLSIVYHPCYDCKPSGSCGVAPKERRRGRAENRLSKGCNFGESVSSLLPKGFQDLSGVLRENLKGAEKKRTLQNYPFGQPFLRTTPSPLLWRILISQVVLFIVDDFGF